MRYYLGIDWADEDDAVWVANEAGEKVMSCRIAHTVAARSEWARWLRERTVLYRLIDSVGRWSNIDVFMVSIFIALLIAAWLGIRSVADRGPVITISFANAEGIEIRRNEAVTTTLIGTTETR